MKLRKLSAFLLVLMYLFPLFYQPIHIYKHHIYCDTDKCSIASQTNSLDFRFQHEDKKCPICDYTSFIQHFSGINLFHCKINSVKFIYNESVTERLFSVFIVEKSQRAPPQSV